MLQAGIGSSPDDMFTGTNSTDSAKIQQELDDLKKKQEKSAQEITRLKQELKAAHDKSTDLEIANLGLKQHQEASEVSFKDQYDLMTNRVQDLTSKLASAEKKVRKLEKKVGKRSRRGSREIGSDKEKAIESKEIDTSEVVDDLDGSHDGEIVASVAVPVLSSSKPMDDDIESDSEKSTLSDPEVVHRLKKLKGELEMSKEKVQELQQRDAEFKSLQQTAQQLTEQNKVYKEQTNYLQTKLQEATMSSKHAEEIRSQLKELEKKFNHSESIVSDCKLKLASLVNELGSFGIVPTKDNYSSTIDSLRDRLSEILREVDRTSGSKAPKTSLNLGSTVKMFAEKLSLEALVIREMAALLRSSQHEDIADSQTHLCEIQCANRHIVDLEQKIDLMQSSNNNNEDPSMDNMKRSLLAHSELLAERMIAHAHMLSTLEKRDKDSLGDTELESMQKPLFASKLAKEALFRSKLDLPLYKSETSQDFDSSLGLASKVLVQGEFSFILNKLRDRMSNTMTDEERIDLLEQELELAEHRLQDREKVLSKSVQSFITDKTKEFAETWLQENHGDETVDSPEKELEEMLKKYGSLYEKEINPKVNISDVNRQRHIHEAVMVASEQAIHKLTESCEQELHKVSIMGRPAVKHGVPVTSAMQILENLAEVVAYKAVISGQIGYLKDQLMNRTRSAKSGHGSRSGSASGGEASARSPSSRAQNRNNSNTSSPDVAEHLSHEAAVRQHLVSTLLSSVENGTLESDVSVKHVTNLAKRLVELDTEMLRENHSIQDYTELVSREAVFQAQMTYVVSCLQLKHQDEVREISLKIEELKQHLAAQQRTPQVWLSYCAGLLNGIYFHLKIRPFLTKLQPFF